MSIRTLREDKAMRLARIDRRTAPSTQPIKFIDCDPLDYRQVCNAQAGEVLISEPTWKIRLAKHSERLGRDIQAQLDGIYMDGAKIADTYTEAFAILRTMRGAY